MRTALAVHRVDDRALSLSEIVVVVTVSILFNILLCEYKGIMINNESSTRQIIRVQHSLQDNSRCGKCNNLSYTIFCEVAVTEKANRIGCHTETTMTIALDITE